MKVAKIALIIFLSMMCIILAVIVYMQFSFEREGTMIINGEEIQDVKVSFVQNRKNQYVLVPLLTVLQKAGYNVERETPEKVNITIGGTIYTLDFQNKALMKGEDINNNLLTPAPGCNYYVCSFTDTDVIIDNVTLKSVCSFMEIPITIDIDFKQQMISITLS